MPDCVADDPVCCELLSAIKFPVKQGKYREFSRFGASRGRPAAEKALSSLWFSWEFPTQPNRELFRGNRELFQRIREFSGRIRETQAGVPKRGARSGLDEVLRGRIAFFQLDISKSQDAAPARIGDG